MTLAINPLLQRTAFPGIAEINALAAQRRAAGRTLVNFGQAVPDYPPPEDAVARVAAALANPDTHRYTPDPGLPELRERWAAVLHQRFGVAVDPHRGMLITAGANQAYLLAAMTVIGPGDRMGILTPYYFNHAMAVTMIGGEVIEIPLRAADRFALDVPRILEVARRERLRALTLVTPNNPTGVTTDPHALRALIAGLHELGVYLIVDETYAFFPDPTLGHCSPAAIAPDAQQILTLGSFSKTFSLTGWRVGYLTAAPSLIEAALKAHDTSVICAPHPGQLLTLACLDTAWAWLDERVAELRRRQETVHRFAPRLAPWRVVADGAYFAWLELPAEVAPTTANPGRAAALRLLAEHDIVLIPGDVFGSGQERALRLAFGCLPEPALSEGLARLGSAIHTLYSV